MANVTVKQTTSAVKVTAQSSPSIRVEVIARGPQGRPGDAGAGGQSYEHVQSSASVEWIVNHNFGRNPIIEILNISGNVVVADIRHVSDNQSRINFNLPQAGKAIAR